MWKSTRLPQVLDLFSGIGGFSYGFEQTGKFKTVAFCEIDEHCQKVLHKNFPHVPVFKDVKELNSKSNLADREYIELGSNVDIICGGFPCQDVSVAGKQRGINEETRSGLWFEYKRIIQEIKPRWVVIENVRNLLSNGLARVLQDLHEIGYDAEWQIISARSVGALHLRERVWIVAYPQCKGQQGRICIDRVSGEMGKEQDSGGSDKCMCESPSCISNSNNFRFWPTFATEEEKQQWWAEATSSIRDRWQTESTICRVADGLPKGLDKARSQRIKQLGNSIVPQIAELIAKRIAEIEGV